MRKQDPPLEFYPETILAIEAARKAGQEIGAVYTTDFSSSLRGGEPVTEADIRSNQVIHGVLGTIPLSILSEESADDKQRLKQKKIWIIDPLDGTSDFVDRTGEFSILISLIDAQQPVMGIVYQPIDDILYVAEHGRGAYRNDADGWHRLAVSSIDRVSQTRVLMSRQHLAEKERSLLDQLGFSHFIQRGSCGLKVASIAEGSADLYFTMTNKIKQWDTAAANCIVTEAGGLMTDMNGSELFYNTDSVHHENGIIASNGRLGGIVEDAYKLLHTAQISG